MAPRVWPVAEQRECSVTQAEKAGTAALGCEEPQEGEGDSGCEDWRACQGLVEELSDALYELALTGTHRVGSMCLSPSGLACWALELLEEQACQAVVFVRDLDRSVLGRGEHGLVHYETLRKATDTVVNAILTVRRLLKQKRAADHEGDHAPTTCAHPCEPVPLNGVCLAIRRAVGRCV